MTDQLEAGPPMNPREHLVRAKSTTMEFFVETHNIDHITAQMLHDYDKDGDGKFSKDEVVSIIIDLRQEGFMTKELGKLNKIYKRLLCVAILFVVMLLSGMFALSFIVAKLTMKTDVADDGTLFKPGTTVIVSTDSRAEIHELTKNEYGVMCTTPDEAMMMKMEVELGRNVVIIANDDFTFENSQEVMVLSGRGTETLPNGDICWDRPDGKLCFQQHFSCHNENTNGRKLSQEQRESLEEQYGGGRFLSNSNRLLEVEYGYGIVPVEGNTD
jgi:hypothetical protein